MIRVVVDTNVIVSAVLSRLGKPAQVLNSITDYDYIDMYYSSEIIDDYSKVLSYERLNIDEGDKNRVIELIRRIGVCIDPTAGSMQLPDEADRKFYDAAKESGAILVTGNIKHYPSEPFIMTPADFLTKMEMGKIYK